LPAIVAAICSARGRHSPGGVSSAASPAATAAASFSGSPAGQHHFHCERLAHCTDQPLYSAGTGNETEVYFWLAETHSFRCDDDIRQQGLFAADSQCVAIHRR